MTPATTLRTAGGDLVIPRVIVTDLASVARQQILDGLALFKGEWLLDQNEGLPWFQIVFGPRLTTTAQIDTMLRTFLLGIANVVSVVATSTLDRSNRLFRYTFQAFLSDGEALNGSSLGTGTPTVTLA